MSRIIFAIAFVYFAIALLGDLVARDDSDPPGGHSGMTIYTDHLTGCQYVSHGWSGLTARLNADGKQVCRP